MSSRWRPAPAAALVLILVVGCTGDGSKPKAEPRSKPSGVEQVAASVGCTRTEKSEPVGGFAESMTCQIDGKLGNRLHTFDERNRTSVERRFSTRYEEGEVADRNVCPEGKAAPYQWIVLGPDWMVVTSHEDVKNDLVRRLDAEVLDEGPGPPYTGYTMQNPVRLTPGRFVLGPDWLMITNHEEVRDGLVENFDAQLLSETQYAPASWWIGCR